MEGAVGIEKSLQNLGVNAQMPDFNALKNFRAAERSQHAKIH